MGTAKTSLADQQRYQKAAWNSLANAMSTGMSMLTLFITIRLTLQYLGPERFGLWGTILSLASALSFLDLGIGNGLVHHIATARAQANPGRLREIVQRGLLLMTLVGSAIALLGFIIIPLLPLEKILSIRDHVRLQEGTQALQVFALLFGLSIPMYGLQRVFFAQQKAWVTHIVKTIGTVVSLAAVWWCSRLHASLPTLLLASFGVQTLSALLLLPLLALELKAEAPFYTPTHLATDVKSLLGIGGLFFALQIGGMIGWGSDAVITTSILGAASAGQLVIAQRLFQCVSVPFAILNNPLWAAYADAHARHDLRFIRQALHRSMFVTFFLSSAASVILVLVCDRFLDLWLGTGHRLPHELVWVFAIWAVMDATGNSLAMYLNGVNVIHPQLIAVLLFCALALPLKFFLAPFLGITGIVLATVVAYALGVVLPYLTFLNKKIRLPL